MVNPVANENEKFAAVATLKRLKYQSIEAMYFLGRSECSGIYDQYGIDKDLQLAQGDIERAASLGHWRAKMDHCN
jgi:hypothetical protein